MKTLEQKNKEFDKLSKAEQRVAIAKDVIKALNSKLFIAKSGIYCILRKKIKVEVGQDLQQVLLDKAPVCTVCGVGALFISAIRVGDKYKAHKTETHSGQFSGFNDPTATSPLTQLYFSFARLDEIENYFEGWQGGRAYNQGEVGSKERLRAIMNNIIKNKGTFKP